MIVMDRVSIAFGECESCGKEHLLRSVNAEGVRFLVCDDCVPVKDRSKSWV